MVDGTKIAIASVSSVGLITLLTGVSVFVRKSPPSTSTLHQHTLMYTMGESKGAVPGRIVSVPVQVYKRAFKSTLKLGQCPLVMDGSTVKTCKERFSGNPVLLAKGGMNVAVTQVQSSEDITTYIMGGIGASAGVLGLVSASVKVNVGVTTDTSEKTLNLLNSYELNKGVLTLHGPKPETDITENGALFLSEIELGGSETLLVTLTFSSKKQKLDVEITVTFKILFWSISAKMKFVHTSFSSTARARIQFKSTWRQEQDITFTDLGAAVAKVKEIEAMYMKGPQELRDLSVDDDRTHNMYYFSSWKQTPYGSNYNLALINHDIEFLTDQNTEMQKVIYRIGTLKDRSWSADQRRQMTMLNETLTKKTNDLTNGLDHYHTLNPNERQKLRDVYGTDHAPLYFSRQLSLIVKE